jgi:1-acyl-sn-glycerol-3-phosphate acyltransferase
LAAMAKVPIVPMVIGYRQRKNRERKPKMTLFIGKPIYLDNKLLQKEQIQKLEQDVTDSMIQMQERARINPPAFR